MAFPKTHVFTEKARMKGIEEQFPKKETLTTAVARDNIFATPIAEVLTSLGAVEIVGAISSFVSESSSIFFFLEALVFSRVPHQ
jgi:hypothetical protein